MADNINLQNRGWMLDLQSCRSSKVKAVYPCESISVAGSSKPESGEIHIPIGEDAESLTVRMHEVLHVDFTPKHKFADILDQALEDARLHAHFSAASQLAKQGLTIPRQAELTVAVDDLTKVVNDPRPEQGPTGALAVIRSMAICQESRYSYHEPDLVAKAARRVAPDYQRKAEEAIRLIGDGGPGSKVWDKAREILRPYFEVKAPPKAEPVDGDFPVDGQDDIDCEPVPDARTAEEKKPEPFIPAPVSKKKPRKPKADPDPDRIDPVNLCPEFDVGPYQMMQADYPVKVYIRRLDKGIDRVKTDLGKNNDRFVRSGLIIKPNRLALSFVNPKLPIFQKKVSKGNAGSVLLDASGSMNITNEKLAEFCSMCPTATVAFYAGIAKHRQIVGNIFVYAANGKRAGQVDWKHLRWYEEDWTKRLEGDNQIDYQAMSWLVQQPGPRFYISDCEFTGSWAGRADEFLKLCLDRKSFTVCENIDALLKAVRR